jgi:hypothetical protein
MSRKPSQFDACEGQLQSVLRRAFEKIACS